MKFSIQRDVLLAGLQAVSSIIEKKNTNELLTYVHLEAKDNKVILSGTDLEVGLQTYLDALISESGKATVSIKNLLEITKELPNKEIYFNLKSNLWMEINCQKAKFNIMTKPAEGYPTFPNFLEKDYNYANSDKLNNMIEKTEFAVSSDVTRYHMNGVYLEPLSESLIRMTATDGHRLSYIDDEIFTKPIELKRGVVIPKKGLSEIKKVLNHTKNIGAVFEKGLLFIKSQDTYLYIRLIEADYPDYRQVIPKSLDKMALLNSEELKSSFKRVSLLANEKSKAVKLTLQDGSLFISTSNPEIGEAKDEIAVDYHGEVFEIGFNSKYVLDCLEVIKSEKIEFHFKDKTKPGLLQGTDSKNHHYIVMPMRI